ncbi:hypothetical protein ILYODFUR_024502 [Ilyodon furcidens]|uniref:Uncharacterized protein n=1 Tax=Ilyodon furcidens TaxID=33524 RepID=A0ABV0TMX2_9TELE
MKKEMFCWHLVTVSHYRTKARKYCCTVCTSQFNKWRFHDGVLEEKAERVIICWSAEMRRILADLSGTRHMFAEQRRAVKSQEWLVGTSLFQQYLHFPTIPHASYMLAH